MFTGLIEEIGRVEALQADAKNRFLKVHVSQIAKEVCEGESVAVNGCCLTVTRIEETTITFNLLQETVERTNFARLGRGQLVNLERALVAGGRLGGHMVQGHIDVTAAIIALEQRGRDTLLEVALPGASRVYLVEKGSVALDGISLTVAEVRPASFVTWIIPHTREHTNLRAARRGDLINIEWDILAKYVERMLPAAIKSAGGIAEQS